MLPAPDHFDRYAEPTRALRRDEARWPLPTGDVHRDAALLRLLTAVDEGLGRSLLGVGGECRYRRPVADVVPSGATRTPYAWEADPFGQWIAQRELALTNHG